MTETATELTPLAEQATAEYRRVLNDPTHPHYEGLRRGDAQAENFVNDLYRRAHGSAPAVFGQGIEVTSTPQSANTDPGSVALSRETSVAQTEIETMLRRTFGEEYDSEMRDMRVGASHLFSQPDSVKVLDEVFAPVITRLGSCAEVAAIRFLAQLGRLSHTPTGGAQ